MVSSSVAPAAERLARTRLTSGRRSVDAEQHGACGDFTLQRLGPRLWQPGGLEHRRQTAREMSCRLAKLRRQRPCRNNGPDSGHHQRDRRQHPAAQFSEDSRRPRIFQVHAGSRVHPRSKGPLVGMTLCDDGDVFLGDAEGMKRPRSLGGGGRSRKQR